MCLTKISLKHEEGTMYVYKVLLITPSGELVTPYIKTPVKLGEKLYSEIPYSECCDECATITDEGVHAYVTLDAARNQAHYIEVVISTVEYYDKYKVAIYGAIIPNTKYWLGHNSEVAAVELLITNKLKYISNKLKYMF